MSGKDDSKGRYALPASGSQMLRGIRGITRRAFLKYSAGTAAFMCLGPLGFGGGSNRAARLVAGYPIDSKVVTTAQRVLSFPMPAKAAGPNSGTGLAPTELSQLSQYGKYGYGNYTFGGWAPDQTAVRYHAGRVYPIPTPVRLKPLANFFAMSDIHITDKETPNQLIYLQQQDAANGAQNTSIYSPVMLYSTQVLDAANPDDQRLAQAKRHLILASRWATRATAPNTMNCGGTWTSSTVESSPPARAPISERRPSITKNPSRRPGSTSRSPGTKPSATTITFGWVLLPSMVTRRSITGRRLPTARSGRSGISSFRI